VLIDPHVRLSTVTRSPLAGEKVGEAFLPKILGDADPVIHRVAGKTLSLYCDSRNQPCDTNAAFQSLNGQ